MASVLALQGGDAFADNRFDCSAIRGTEYLSEEEREWFRTNCINVNACDGVELYLWCESSLGSDGILFSHHNGMAEQILSGTPEMSELICSYPWPCKEALGVVYGNERCQWGESTGRPWVVAGGNYGLFQIHAASHTDKFTGPYTVLLDPEINVAVAYAIYSDQGWAPWGCRP